ncbi:Hsp33 family molecular chaperone HslO, partial [Bacillus sp. WP8]|uniref:Hsp33 family molecular chaperone HslO n=1 Tax=Bacillus sp. WP8 TaxID=756828 RepID=UPI0011A0CBA2
IIQLLPSTKDPVIETLQNHLSTIQPISKLIQKPITPQQILQQLLPQKPQILQTLPLQFSSNSSKQPFPNRIITLAKPQ